MTDKKDALTSRIQEAKNYKKDANGKYVYTGDLYKLNMTKKEIDGVVKRMWIYAGIAFVLELLGGVIPFAGMMESYYVVVPYCAELIMEMLLFWACFHFSTYRYAMAPSQYNKSVRRSLTVSVVYMLLGLISIICSIVYVIINGFHNDVLFFIIYLLGKMAIIAVNFFINKYVASLDFRVSKNGE